MTLLDRVWAKKATGAPKAVGLGESDLLY